MADASELNLGTLNYENHIMSMISFMQKYKVEDQQEKYWRQFQSVARLLVPYLPPTIRKQFDEDYRLLAKYQAEIEETEKNDISRKKAIEELHFSFADAHEPYCYSALTRVGIVKVSDEGLLKFDEYDVETLRMIINESSTKRSTEKVIAMAEEPTEEPKEDSEEIEVVKE